MNFSGRHKVGDISLGCLIFKVFVLFPALLADGPIVPDTNGGCQVCGPGLSLVTSPAPWTLSSWSLSVNFPPLLFTSEKKYQVSDSLLFTRLLSVPIIMDIPGLRMINARVIVALWSWQCRQHGVTHFTDAWFIQQGKQLLLKLDWKDIKHNLKRPNL